MSIEPRGAADTSHELGRALAEELRGVLRALNERHLDEVALADALAQARALRAALDGPRRPRWYETGLIDGRSTNDTRQRFGEHSLFRGEQSAIAPPLRYWIAERDEVPGRHPTGGRVIEGTAWCSLLYEGPPGGVHGGYVAGLFDDILGGTQQLLDGPSGLTGVLTVRYRNLTPLETELRFTAWIDAVSGRRIHAKATCHAGDVLTADAEALFIRVDMNDVAARAIGERTGDSDQLRGVASAAMIVIAGTITFDPAKRADLESGFDTMRAASLAEDGCLEYQLYNDRKDAGVVLILEKWASDEALAAHMATPHMAAFGQVMGAIGIKGIDIKKYSGATEGTLM